jgi:hypothetical protein
MFMRGECREAIRKFIAHLHQPRLRVPPQLVLHRGAVVHVVQWIAEDHVRQAAGEHFFHSLDLRRVAAQQLMLADSSRRVKAPAPLVSARTGLGSLGGAIFVPLDGFGITLDLRPIAI